jgi:hypothetical protein
MNVGKLIFEWLNDPAVEEKIVKSLNDSVDIPFINEKTEEKIAKAVWSSVRDVLKKIFEDGK